MYISSFRVKNYKSYLDSGEVSLAPGINIITGQNNAGKTALLQALSLNFNNNFHKSSYTVPNRLHNEKTNSSIEIEINVLGNELKDYFLQLREEIRIKERRGQNEHFFIGEALFDNRIKDINSIYLKINENKGIVDSYFKFIGDIISNRTYIYGIDPNNFLQFRSISNTHSQESSVDIGKRLFDRVYIFNAERLNISYSPFGIDKILKPNASNLPEVLNILQGERYTYAKYVEFVKKIFPQIFDITLRPDEQRKGNVEIVIWNEDPKNGREDLVVPLSESGTGIGQVLAILYVVLTSKTPTIIIIDEPNSFLHPGASRKLIEILKEYPQHQFIISTHSPSTIAAANPKTINIVRNQNAQSTIEAIDVAEAKYQQLYLAEIGSKLSDVFGADNILWVEGKTEELCFPKIIDASPNVSLMGTSILAVRNTGDLSGKNAKLTFELYQKLSGGKGLVPPAVGFIFDSENKNQKEKDDIIRQSQGQVIFLERMMYENYLLNSAAIFNVLNNIVEIKDLNVTQEAVRLWIEDNKWNKKFIKLESNVTKDENNWLKYVRAADFLDILFSEISQTRLKFDKIKHSIALTEWIIENSIDDLKEIQDLLRRILV